MNEKLKIVTDTYGIDNQLIKLQEEIDEFKKEIILYQNGVPSYDHGVLKDNIERITDEYGDVLNVLSQFELYYKLNPDEIMKHREAKLDREMNRIIVYNRFVSSIDKERECK